MSDPKREMLRHALATIAYRGGKTIRNAPPTFAAFRISESSRTPAEILAHIGDLFDWALSIARGARAWHDAPTRPWPEEVARFFATLRTLDEYLASDAALAEAPEKLLQAAIADALTHIGQLALLRGAAGAPIRGESYYEADIVTGRVGPDQTPPRREF